MLIAFEGLDQSGKETQARHLRARLEHDGRKVRMISFPDYETPVGREIALALQGDREFGPEVMQLLYVANRFEYRPRLQTWLAAGDVVLCDRYVASSIAYGVAHGLEAGWLDDIQRGLPPPDLTVLLDIAPATAVSRKASDRDRYERDLELLDRVRAAYQRLATSPSWVLIDAEQPRDQVSAAIEARVLPRFAPPSPRERS